jgi:general secretion pathway protein D
MLGLRTFLVRAAVFAALVLLSPVRAFGDGADVRLQHVTSAVAPDGSAQLTLAFDGAAPETRVIRSDDHNVHLVMIGATIAPTARLVKLGFGEITQGTFAGFAGIGIRLDLRTRDRVAVRTDAEGSRLFVHVPARSSDREAPRPLAQAAQLPLASPAPSTLVTETIRLSYADVSEVAGALVKGATVPSNDTFNAISPFVPTPPPSNFSGGGSSAASSRPTYVSIPAATILPKDSPIGVRFDDHVAVDRRLNAVILTGTPAEVNALKAVVAQLDVPARSVLLETQIVELTETGAKDLGIDYSPNDSTLATATFSANTNTKPEFGLDLSAAVSALQQTGQAKILARPRILAMDNRPAAILSGEAVPIFTSVVVPGGGTVIEQQVQYMNVGVSLQILPRISADGRVTTQLFCEVSSIIDFSQSAPVIAVRQELTSAVVNDSESLIVGGLLQETEIKNLKKIPSLGNLPLIGQFFRNETNSSQNTNLYIVVTPHILSNGVGSTSGFDLPPQPVPLPTIPPPDATIVPGEFPTPPPASR